MPRYGARLGSIPRRGSTRNVTNNKENAKFNVFLAISHTNSLEGYVCITKMRSYGKRAENT
jgi:hypothetical protein